MFCQQKPTHSKTFPPQAQISVPGIGLPGKVITPDDDCGDVGRIAPLAIWECRRRRRGHRMTAKFLVKKSDIAAQHCQYYTRCINQKKIQSRLCKKIMGGRYFKWSIISQLRN